MKRICGFLWWLVSCVSLLASAYAAEPSFPDRPLRIAVPFALGGGSDFVARVLSVRMVDVLEQNAIVDTRLE